MQSTTESVAPTHRSKTWLKLLGWVLGAALLYYVFHGVDGAELWKALKAIPVSVIVGVCICNILGIAFRGIRFWVIFPAGLSVLKHIALSFCLYAGNTMLPARAGELYRPLYLTRRDPKLAMKDVIAFSVCDRLGEMIMFFIVFACGAWIFADDASFGDLTKWMKPIVGGLVVVAIGLGIWAFLRQKSKAAESAWGPSTLVKAVFLSIPVVIANIAVFAIVMMGWRLGLALWLATSFGAAIPALPAGFGAFDAAFVVTAKLKGIPQTQALALALVTHILQIVSTLAVGIPCLLKLGWPSRSASASLPKA